MNLNFKKSRYVINKDGSITRAHHDEGSINSIECDFGPITTIKNIWIYFWAFYLYTGSGIYYLFWYRNHSLGIRFAKSIGNIYGIGCLWNRFPFW